MQQIIDENGRYILNNKYTEILKLDKMLDEAEIPHTLERSMDGWQVCYPDVDNCVADAIEFYGSYGSEENLLEIMGLLTPEEAEHDSVLGHLTAENVFERMRAHYEATKTEKGGAENG